MSIAYDVPAGQIQGGPDWFRTGTTRYDVDGKAADPSTATEAELKSMLQQLVAESFRLQFHREARNVTGWALVVDKNGSKLRNPRDGEEDPVVRTGGSTAAATIEATKTSMTTLAKLLSGIDVCITGAPGPLAPVVDKTQLAGLFTFKLAWTSCRAPEAGNSGSTIPFALRDQLGLKLERASVAQEFLIVDHAEKPTQN